MQVYKKISTSIADKLIDKEVICKEKYSIFQYGCELMISTGVSTIIFVIISFITQSFLSSMFFYAGFLRYHFWQRRYDGAAGSRKVLPTPKADNKPLILIALYCTEFGTMRANKDKKALILTVYLRNKSDL